jgi:hypothetical protein
VYVMFDIRVTPRHKYLWSGKCSAGRPHQQITFV